MAHDPGSCARATEEPRRSDIYRAAFIFRNDRTETECGASAFNSGSAAERVTHAEHFVDGERGIKRGIWRRRKEADRQADRQR